MFTSSVWFTRWNIIRKRDKMPHKLLRVFIDAIYFRFKAVQMHTIPHAKYESKKCNCFSALAVWNAHKTIETFKLWATTRDVIKLSNPRTESNQFGLSQLSDRISASEVRTQTVANDLHLQLENCNLWRANEPTTRSKNAQTKRTRGKGRKSYRMRSNFEPSIEPRIE